MPPVPTHALVVALIALVLAPSAALAQNATSGAARGRVTSTANSAPIAGAQVVLTNVETGFSRSALTTDAGAYTAQLLPPGRYRARVQRIGFRPAETDTFRVRLNETITADIVMEPAPVQIEGVTVTTTQPLQVDTKQQGVAEYVSEREIQQLPTLGRDFTDFIALSGLVSPQPEVTTGGSVAIGGGRTSGVNVQIDGADANFNFFGESRGGARIPFTFSLQSIKEFQVITNGYDVEFGNYSSGVVNVVTQGGTNRFRGNVQGFFRTNNLTAENFSQSVTINGRDTTLFANNRKRPFEYEVQQFAGAFSGPIVRDRLHFLVSYDGQRRKDPFAAISPLATNIHPDSIERMIDILETVYGQTSARSDFGDFNKTDDVDVVFGRLDWTLNEAHRASFRANYADYASLNDGLQFGGNRARTFAATFADRNLSLVGEVNSVFSGSSFNTLRVQFAEEKRPRTSNNFLPLMQVNVEGTRRLEYGGSGITYRNRLRETKIQLVDNYTHRLGAHTLKIGTNNMFSEVYNLFWLFGAGTYTFGSLADLQARRPSQYTRNIPLGGPRAPETTFNVTDYSVYAQDEWQVTPRLVATLGVRWDAQRWSDDFPSADFVENLPGLDFETGISPNSSNISPRLSAAYDLFGDQRHVLRAGGGVFYSRVPTVIGSNVGTGSDPYLSLDCRGAAVPVPAYETFAPDGSTNPATCVGTTNLTGNREYTFFGPDFESPRTFKGSVGYEGRVLANTRFGVDVLFSRTDRGFSSADLSLREQPVSRVGAEGNRPFYATLSGTYNPSNTPTVADRSRFAQISRIFVNESKGKAEEFAVTLRLDQHLGSRGQLRGSYTFNRAKDNVSRACCTAFELLFSDPTAGDLNNLGDEDGPQWGNSAFVRPHTFVFSGSYDLPWRFNLSGIYRAMSGTYFTPTLFGDVNGDGNRDNDLPYIGQPDEMLFERPQDRAAYEEALAENECLRDALGTIIERNTCRNPWFHQLDMSVKWSFPIVGERSVELVADFFNVLNGLNSEWGQFKRVGQREILAARSFNTTAGKFVYRSNDRFGEDVFLGPTRQFQTQLGMRVSF